MRTNISCSFLRSRKVAGLAVLFSAIFGASSNVLAQEGSDVISLADGQSATTSVKVSRQDMTVTRVLEFTGSTPTWSVLENPSSGSVVFAPGNETTAMGVRATVVYTFSPPVGNIGFGANDRFVVGVSADDERATLTFSVTIAADDPQNSPPRILDTLGTLPNDSTNIEVLDGSTQVEITLRATDDDTDADMLTWSVSTYTGAGGSVTFAGGEDSATGTEVIVVYQNVDGIDLTADTIPRLIVGVSDDSGGMDSVQVYLVELVRSSPVISYGEDDQVSTVTVSSYERVSTADFVLSASNPDPVGGGLNWSLTVPSTGTAVFVTSDGDTSEMLTTTEDDAPATIRFTRPDPDGDFQGTTFRITATGVSSELSDSVVVDIVNVPNTTPTIAGTTRSRIHAQMTTVDFTFIAGDLDPGDDGNLEWGLSGAFGDRSTAVLVNAAGDEVSSQTGTTVRVRFSQFANFFEKGVTTRTFIVTLSDDLTTARSTVTVVIDVNQPPEIVSIDGSTVRPFSFVVSPNLLNLTFSAIASDDYEEDQLTWEFVDSGATGESTVTFITTDGTLQENPVGTAVRIRLERKSSETTTSFTLGLDDTGGESSTTEVIVDLVAVTVPKIRFPGFQPISEGKTVEYTFTADDEGLGQKDEGLTWSVSSTDNVKVSLPSTQGVSVTVTATLQVVSTRLNGSYVLEVTNSDGNSTRRTVPVERANEAPVITPGLVMLTLVGQNTTVINFSADDPVGLTTLTWSFVGDASPDGDSTVRFVANGVRSTRTTGTTVRVLFIGPPPSSEGDIDRSFQVLVEDGVEDGLDGSSTAIVEIRILPNPVIYYRIRMFLGGAAR